MLPLMYGSYLAKLRRGIVNLALLPGWRTKTKYLVIMADDYGAIRMPSQAKIRSSLRAKLSVPENRFNKYDTLESNTDLELLFETLDGNSDRLGNPAVMTPLALVANPDFDKIAADNFQRYHHEPVEATVQRYCDHDRVTAMWTEGRNRGLFVPEFHGREHLNVMRWMRALRGGNRVSLTSFAHGVACLDTDTDLSTGRTVLKAFDLDRPEDVIAQRDIVREGLDLFEKRHGKRAVFFTPPNALYNHALDGPLAEGGIKFINVAKLDREPLGHGRYRWRPHYLGQVNRAGLRYIIRTAVFEPSLGGGTDWVNRCLADISFAFNCNKPAIISTHRVSFSGSIDAKNRGHGLRQLDLLLRATLKHWPDVEFVSMRDLASRMTA